MLFCDLFWNTCLILWCTAHCSYVNVLKDVVMGFDIRKEAAVRCLDDRWKDKHIYAAFGIHFCESHLCLDFCFLGSCASFGYQKGSCFLSWNRRTMTCRTMDNYILLEEELIKKSQQKRRTSPSNYKVRFFTLSQSSLTYSEHRPGVCVLYLPYLLQNNLLKKDTEKVSETLVPFEI